MSKKQKALGKAGKSGGIRKAAAPVKKQGKTSAKSAPAKSSAKKVTKPAAGLKKGVKSAGKIKTAPASSKKTAAKKQKPQKKGLVKKLVKVVKKLITPKKSDKPSPALKKSSSKSEAINKQKQAVQPASKSAKVQTSGISKVKQSTAEKNGSPKTKQASKAEQPEKKGRALSDLFSKKGAERKTDDVLAITNTIPVKAENKISQSKIASISYSITNPVRKTDSYAIKPEKEPQGKFELEFVVHASAEMLYEFLSTPSGLSEWFCDDLNIRNGIYTFIWDDQLQQARLLKTIDQQLVRFQWVDKTDGSYFEFRIQRDDLTNDISLIITDFADTSAERESSKLLWNSQVEKLMHVIGSIF